jgi:NADH:ubiquinone oxidoreductase subunit 3 (subunit A)
MIGPILIFLAVCVIVATFMFVAHSFLREAEKDEESITPAEHLHEESDRVHSQTEPSQHPQWAH